MATPTEEFDSAQWSRRSVMIVDDQARVRSFLRNYLSSLHITKIVEASNGREAVDIVSHWPKLDIVMMDLKMPEMDGLEAIEQMRAINPSIWFIILTGYLRYPGIFKVAAEAGAFVLMKPIEIDDLDHIMKTVLRSSV